jgi:hypothetical protein
MAGKYFVYRYKPDGIKAVGDPWEGTDQDATLKAVGAILKDGDVAQVECPVGTSPEFFAELKQLGARPTWATPS